MLQQTIRSYEHSLRNRPFALALFLLWLPLVLMPYRRQYASVAMDRIKQHRTFPCDPGQVAVIRNWAADAVVQAGFSEAAVGDIRLALSEAITNIIVHSVGQRREECIEVTVDVDDQRALFLIRDYGECFDLDRYEDPDLNQLAEGGYGIFLMRDLMDGVEFTSHDAGNEVRMWKAYTPAPDG